VDIIAIMNKRFLELFSRKPISSAEVDLAGREKGT